jgi:hypothetical protein
LTFGETLCEVCEPFSDYQGWLSSSWLQQQDLWLDVLPAAVDLPRRYCFRYLKVEVKAVSEKFRLRLNQIQVNAVTSATQTCPPAVTTDPQLQAIDRVAVLTLKNCMQEVFEDGPKRDRRLWLGDLRLQALVNDVTFAHHDLVRRCLYLFAGHTREDGMVSANVFVQPDVLADDTFLFDSLFLPTFSITICTVPKMTKPLANSGRRRVDKSTSPWPAAKRLAWCAIAMTGGSLSTGRHH